MASRQQIKQKINSVKSTRQITKAMQLVAASKLRRAQEAVQGPRQYSQVAREMLTVLRKLAAQDATFDLFKERDIKKRLLIVVTSDRSLAGAYNSNIIRRMLNEVRADRSAHVATSVVCIGKKVAQAAARVENLEVAAVYTEFPDKPGEKHIKPIITDIVRQFMDGDVDAVDLIFTRFNSSVNQEVTMQRLLPAGMEETEVPRELEYAEVEPSLDALLESTTVRLLEVQIYQALLDSVTSEHSMRMLAMKNATDNANELVEDYTLEYNNARQAAITQELAEISGGAEALNG